MGISISRQTDLSENTYLNQFVGKNHIPATDNEFWNSFLQYQIALPTNRYLYVARFRCIFLIYQVKLTCVCLDLFIFSEEQLSLDSRLETMCQQFISHNLATGKLRSILTQYWEYSYDIQRYILLPSHPLKVISGLW